MTLVQGDYVRVSANFELGDGTQYQNVYHYLRDGAEVVSDAVTLAAIALHITNAYGELEAFTSATVTEKLCFVDQVGWVVDQWKIIANVGTFTPTFVPDQVGDGLPYTVAPFVVFKTTRPKSVGRKFLFPFDEAWQADSIIHGTAIAGMVAYGALVLADIELAPAAALIPGILRVGVETWLSFQVAVVNDVLGSQKRRRPGVGA